MRSTSQLCARNLQCLSVEVFEFYCLTTICKHVVHICCLVVSIKNLFLVDVGKHL